MPSRIAPHQTLCVAAVVVAGMSLAAVACDPSQFTQPPTALQSCAVTNSSNFPAGGSLTFNKPANCPVQLLGAQDIPYAAHAHLPNSMQYNYQEITGKSWKGFDVGVMYNAVWSTGLDGQWMVDINGDYWAAASGFDNNNQGYDDIYNYFYTGGGQQVYAKVHVVYSYGQPNNDVSAPGAVRPGDAYTATTTTHDWRLTGDLTYTWYVNGQLQGTTTSPSTTLYAGSTEWSTDQIQVVATDAYGHSASGGASVNVMSACSGSQLVC